MARVVSGLMLLLLLATGGLASPWPRAPQGVFLALSAEGDRSGNHHAGLYGEYGLGPRDTLGIELGRSSGGESSLMFWWQRTLDRGGGPDRWALSLGSGVLRRDDGYLPMLQVGAGWGRGFDAVPVLRDIPGGGWLAAEARFKVAGAMKDQESMQELAADGAPLLAYLTPETTAKAELTIGWNAMQSLKIINQFRFETRDDTGFSGKLSLSAVGDLPGPARLEAGVIAPFSGPGEAAVRIGTWLEF